MLHHNLSENAYVFRHFSYLEPQIKPSVLTEVVKNHCLFKLLCPLVRAFELLRDFDPFIRCRRIENLKGIIHPKAFIAQPDLVVAESLGVHLGQTGPEIIVALRHTSSPFTNHCIR